MFGAPMLPVRALTDIGSGITGAGVLKVQDLGPQGIVNNAEIRDFCDNPFFGRVKPGNPLSGRRVFSITEAIPNPFADI